MTAVAEPASLELLAERHNDASSAGTGSYAGRITVGGAIFGTVVLLGFLVRIWDVGSRAMHLDESTVAWFAWRFLTGNGYTYNPVYHGPFQHEMLALMFLLFQPSQTSARLIAVTLGTGLVALPWFIRDYLGRAAALTACFLLAISPSFVYFGRFERDDTYMEFFTFLMVVCAMRFLRDRRPWQVYALGVAFALAFATKESIYIVAFIFGSFAMLCALGFWLAARQWQSKGPVGATEASYTTATNSRLATSVVDLGQRLSANLRRKIGLAARNGWLSASTLFALGILVLGSFSMVVATGASGTESSAATLATLGAIFLAMAVVVACSACVAALSAMESTPAAGRQFATWAPIIRVLKAHWLNALTVSVGIIVLMYSTFGTNLGGLWDSADSFFNGSHATFNAAAGSWQKCQYPLALNLNACRTDITGGLFYWLSQHKVARGGQPWFYYLLIYGLYEQLAIIFGLIATLKLFLARSLLPMDRLTRALFAYWAVLAFGIYSWAGEKFPWLGIHPLLPITILAAIGLHDCWNMRRFVVAGRLALIFAGLLILGEIHNTYELNFVNGADPVEMMVYVQSSPDTITDADLITKLSNRATNGPTLKATIDSDDAWPFAWYLRDMPNVGYPGAQQAVKPPYSTNPVIILSQTNSYQAPATLATNYTRRQHYLDRWFPEDYKAWSWSDFLNKANAPSSWRGIWDWETERKPFGPIGGDTYYVYVKKGYFAPF